MLVYVGIFGMQQIAVHYGFPTARLERYGGDHKIRSSDEAAKNPPKP